MGGTSSKESSRAATPVPGDERLKIDIPGGSKSSQKWVTAEYRPLTATVCRSARPPSRPCVMRRLLRRLLRRLPPLLPLLRLLSLPPLLPLPLFPLRLQPVHLHLILLLLLLLPLLPRQRPRRVGPSPDLYRCPDRGSRPSPSCRSLVAGRRPRPAPPPLLPLSPPRRLLRLLMFGRVSRSCVIVSS
jgi:hypothetical protein